MSIQIVTRWSVAVSDPLVSDAYRQRAAGDLSELSCSDPKWFRIWAAGLLWDMIDTLDPADPWRQVSRTQEGVVLPDGTAFGNWVNATDIFPFPPEGIPELDLSLASLTEPLTEDAKTLWLAAQQGRVQAREAMELMSAQRALAAAVQAIKWAIFRRRVFTGQEDLYIPLAIRQWGHQAQMVLDGAAESEETALRQHAASVVEPGTWELLVHGH